MRNCYYIAAGTREGARATEGIRNPARVYRAENDAQEAAELATATQPGRFEVGQLDDIPEWATEVETIEHEILPPAVVPNDDAKVCAMRYRPATQYGALPPGVTILHWTRVPENLHSAFPDHPVSKRPFGEFVANRQLSDDELEHFQIDEIG